MTYCKASVSISLFCAVSFSAQNCMFPGSVYFWNIILILVTFHRPCPVGSLEHVFSFILDKLVLKFAAVLSIVRISFYSVLGLFCSDRIRGWPMKSILSI